MYEWQNTTTIELLTIAMLVAVLAIITKTIYTYIGKRNKEKVIANSERLEKLDFLNEKYKSVFIEIQNEWIFSVQCKSKSQLDNFNYDKYFTDVLIEDLQKYKRVIDSTQFNIKNHDLYIKEVETIKSQITVEECKKLKISYDKFIKIEDEMFLEKKLQPVINPQFIFEISYCSPKGRNFYSDSKRCGIKGLISHYNGAVHQVNYQQTKAYQRSLMTPGLRMKILKRDNYRCQICGKSAKDGVSLEVDHIIPIAKGGQTVESNLQTLCWDCNRGKSDKY